jgi:large subunit ribosomal protein L6
VTITVEGNTSTVKGPKGELKQHVPTGLEYTLEEGQFTVVRPEDTKQMRANHGLVRSLISNQVVGVSEGFTKSLEIIGVGYRAAVKGKVLDLQLQFSHPVEYTIPEGIEITCPQPTRIDVKGLDKQLVGQVAAEIRKYRKPEPYKGKGIRYLGEQVVRKAGKAATK